MNLWGWLRSKAQSTTDLIQSTYAWRPSGRRQERMPRFSRRVTMEQIRAYVYSATMLNARRCASQPLRMYVRNRDATKVFETRPVARSKRAYLASPDGPGALARRKAIEFGDDYTEVVGPHPLFELMDRGNQWMHGNELNTLRFAHMQLCGDAFMHPIVKGGIPTELWIMYPHWMKIVPGRGDDFVKQYEYGETDEVVRTFQVDEVLHFRMPNPRDPYYGMGFVEAAWPTIQTDAANELKDWAMGNNYGRPDFVAGLEGASAATVEQVQAAFEERFSGAKDAGRGLFTNTKLAVHPLSWAPKDMGGRQEILEKISGVWGVPVTKIQANDPNRANAEQADYGWAKDTLLPLLRLDEDVLNRDLLPMFDVGEDAFLAYDSPVPDDKETQANRLRLDYQAGVRTLNETRTEQGLEPMDDGDEMYTPPAPPEPEGRSDPEDGDEDDDDEPAKGQTKGRHIHRRRKAPAEQNIRDDRETRIQALIAKLRTQLEILRAEVLALADGRVKADDPFIEAMRLIVEARNQKLAAAVVRDIAAFVVDGGVSAGGAVDVFVRNPAVERYARETAMRLSGGLAQTVVDELATIHGDWQASGDGVSALKRSIQEATGFSPARAETIARTESAAAFVEGEVQAWESSGVVVGKQWLLAPDACPYCEAAAAVFNAQPRGLRDVPLPKGTRLSTAEGTMDLSYRDVDGPPLHPNCRCDLMPVLGE